MGCAGSKTEVNDTAASTAAAATKPATAAAAAPAPDLAELEAKMDKVEEALDKTDEPSAAEPAAEEEPEPGPGPEPGPEPEPEPEPELVGGAAFAVSSFVYAANDPCEDHFTAAVHTDDTMFAGVWDGNGGPGVAQYISEHASESFFEAHDMLGSLAAMNTVFPQLDAKLLERAAKQAQHRSTLFCGSCCIAAHIDPVGRGLTVGNLGDSRAVLGVFERCSEDTGAATPGLCTVVLTQDHSADSKLEQERIAELHGSVDAVITTALDGSCRVKGIALVTRSLGLQHLKVMVPCLAFNKQVVPANRILPRPGGPSKVNNGQKVPPYILNEAEITEWTACGDSFLILASDGVWDELSCEEAVECVGKFLSQTEEQRAQLQRNVALPQANESKGGGAAAVLVEAALRKAHARIVTTVEEEVSTTFEDLLGRAPGKEDTWPYGRSLLHDDMTAVVIEMPLVGVTASERSACVASKARRTRWALGSPPDHASEKQDSKLAREDGSSRSEDDNDDRRLRRQTVEAIPAEQEAAILEALDDGNQAPRPQASG